MEIDQVVYEYGKLQLNFVSCQRQNIMLSQQFAQVNKTVGALTADKGKALSRVAQLEALLKDNGLALPAEPEPAKDNEAAGPSLVPDPAPAN